MPTPLAANALTDRRGGYKWSLRPVNSQFCFRFSFLKLDSRIPTFSRVLLTYVFYFKALKSKPPSFSPFSVPKNTGKRPDTSPVVSRAASQQRGQLAKGNQALQVPAVALYPSRKKVPVKDLPPFGKIEMKIVVFLKEILRCLC